MTADELVRLRRRLTASYAAVSLIVLLALTVAMVVVARNHRRERQDRAVERTALAADGYAYPEGSPRSHLVIDRQPSGYFGPDRHPGAPVVVVDPTGRVVAGPGDLLDGDAARRAFARVRDANGLRTVTDTSGGERVRVAASPVAGVDRTLAAIVAVEPLSAVAADVRASTLRIGAITLGLWLLTILGSWLLAGRALRAAAASSRREEAFLADAAHELRTPVTVIRARAEQALRELDPALTAPGMPAADALRAIESAAQQASGTIADMLELARLDARRERVEREPLRLDLLLEQLAEQYAEPAALAGAELRLEIAAEAVVLADERLLGRAVANLIENAIRYGAAGGTIDLCLAVDGEAIVEVRDRGHGVPPAQQAAIFDRFSRASGVAGGAGLGLPIARLVAETHGGSLELRPTAGDEPGACFRLRLPLVSSES